MALCCKERKEGNGRGGREKKGKEHDLTTCYIYLLDEHEDKVDEW